MPVAAAAAALVATGLYALEPAPARAAHQTTPTPILQGSGPIGIVRGQSADIAILLPAVQRTSNSASVTLTFQRFPTANVFATKTVTLNADHPAAALTVSVGPLGHIYIDGVETDQVLAAGARLELVGLSSLVPAVQFPPSPCASLEVIDLETNSTHIETPMELLPAVQ